MAETLYVATSLRHVAPSEIVGRLYVVDPKTAAAKVVGPVRIPGKRSIGISGLAVHPKTRLLYGITAGLASDIPPSLVVIDPKTAEATMVGALGAPASDINFDAKGTLYAWLSDTNQLATIDLLTGAVTRRGPSGLAGTGGGFAIDRKGQAFVAADTAAGTLSTIDLGTGGGTPGPTLTRAPYLSAITSLTFSPEGELFGVNTNLASPAKAALVTIEPNSGTVIPIGELPLDADGLAFSPDATAEFTPPSRVVSISVLVIAFVCGIAIAVVLFKQVRAHGQAR